MSWGTRRDAAGFIHVVPCTDDGYILAPHVFDRDCPCQPEPDRHDPHIYVHNAVH